MVIKNIISTGKPSCWACWINFMVLSKLPVPRFLSWISLGPSRETKSWQFFESLILLIQLMVPLVIMVINMSFWIKVLTKSGKLGRVKTSPPQNKIDFKWKFFFDTFFFFAWILACSKHEKIVTSKIKLWLMLIFRYRWR